MNKTVLPLILPFPVLVGCIVVEVQKLWIDKRDAPSTLEYPLSLYIT